MKHRIILTNSPELSAESRLLLTQLAQMFSYELLPDVTPVVGDLIIDPNDGLLKYLWDCDAPAFGFSLVDQSLFHQKKRYHLKSEPLARAIGTKSLSGAQIIDATCGTGRDLCLLLSFGAQNVLAYERHPIVYCLLKYQWESLQKLFPQRRLELYFGQVEQLQDPEQAVIYFDPMYPEKKKKSSLSRKEMEFFKLLVGDDPDAQEFLAQLKALRPKRLIAKRPLKAAPWNLVPTDSFKGKSTRYDLFV